MEKQHFCNTPYDIDHVIVAARKTVDGKWACLYSLWATADEKVKVILAQERLRANNRAFYESIVNVETLSVPDKNHHIYLIAEIDASEYNFKMNKEAALIELRHIEKRMGEINPHCKYKDLPVLERIMAIQEKEWEHEYEQRIRHYTLAGISSAIPHDQISAMLTHPRIGPAIPAIVRSIAEDIKAIWEPPKADTRVSLSLGDLAKTLAAGPQTKQQPDPSLETGHHQV